jgi:hypothetical protein
MEAIGKIDMARSIIVYQEASASFIGLGKERLDIAPVKRIARIRHFS